MTETAGLFLGVDAGATKTTACVCDAHGGIRGLVTGGPGAWEAVGEELAAAEIATCVARALCEAGAAVTELAGSGFGVAGLDWPEDEARVARMLVRLGLPERPVLVNDAFAALRAGVDGNVGCVSCAGTGAVTAARDRRGRTFQTYAIGWGEQVWRHRARGGGDRCVVAAHYGSAPATLLTDFVLGALGADSVDDAVRAATREGRRPGPELAPLVLDAARLGDSVAVAIARAAGAALAETAAAVSARLGIGREPFTIVRAGGVHLAGSTPLDDAFRLTLHTAAPAARVSELRLPPAAGAAMLALDASGVLVSLADVERSLAHGSFALGAT